MILANSALLLYTLALPDLPPKFYLISQAAFHGFTSTMIRTVFVLTVPSPSSYTDRTTEAKTVVAPVMGMGQTGRAPWAIVTHTSMFLHSIPSCYEVLIEEKQTSGQEPECGNEGEKKKSRGRFCIFWGFLSGLLICLSMGNIWLI